MPETDLQLLPKPPRAGLYVVLGDNALIPWALQRITVTYADASKIVWIDAANRFNAHVVAMCARSVYMDVNEALRSYWVARPFTAYQLEAMVAQKLLPTVHRTRALFSVVADPLYLYQAAEGRDTQIEQSYQRFVQGLLEAAKRTAILMLGQEDQPYRWLNPVLKRAAQVLHFKAEQGHPQLAWAGR